MSEGKKKPTKTTLLPDILSDKNFNNGLRLSAIIALFIGVTCWVYYFCFEWLAIKLHITLEWDKATIIQIAIAVTAFFTLGFTAWQRILNTKQQEIQIEQLKLGNQQFQNATDNLIETQKNNLAKLLVDGTKLLGTDTTDAEKMAGVICLSYIIDVPDTNNVFAYQAVNVLKMFVNERARQSPKGMDCDDNQIEFDALDVIDKYNQNNGSVIVLHNVTIKAKNKIMKPKMWPNTKGIIYDGYYFRNKIFDENHAPFKNKNCKFFRCQFNHQGQILPIAERKLKANFNANTGEFSENETNFYPYESIFTSCLFGTSTSKPNAFDMVALENRYNYRFVNCYFDDKIFTEFIITDGFINWHIRPLSDRDVDAPPLVPPSVT